MDKAQLLTLTAPEMTVLIGGMRVLNANCEECQHGVFTGQPETLTNDFFVNLLDMSTKWTASSTSEDVYEGRDGVTGELKWTGTSVDLVFGRTPSSGPSRKSMHARIRRSRLSTISQQRGTR